MTRAANAEDLARWSLSATTEQLADVLGDMEQGAAFMAEIAGRCVGAVGCRVLDGGKGYVKRLGVSPEWRRRGIATRLMRAAEEYLA